MRTPAVSVVFSTLLACPAIAAPADAGAPDTAEVIVGSPRGLEAWRLDGSGSRTISKGMALHPRWLDDQQVLVLVYRDDDLAKGGRLERISLRDGKRSRVVKLPPFACQPTTHGNPDAGPETSGQEAWFSLNLQDPSDFTVDRKNQRACLCLMDRNVNMMDYAVELAADLKTGKVRRWLSLGGETCVPPAGVKVGDRPARWECPVDDVSTGEQVPTASLPFSFDDKGVLKKGFKETGEPVLMIPGYSPEYHGLSPSGRWLVLGGDQEDADYIHRGLVLLDRQAGEVYPIVERRSWPAPLRPRTKPGKRRLPRIKTPIANACPAVGETDLRWLGDSAESEYLIVGDLIVKPGAFSFAVDGAIIR
jgi:hypothetical protein